MGKDIERTREQKDRAHGEKQIQIPLQSLSQEDYQRTDFKRQARQSNSAESSAEITGKNLIKITFNWEDQLIGSWNRVSVPTEEGFIFEYYPGAAGRTFRASEPKGRYWIPRDGGFREWQIQLRCSERLFQFFFSRGLQ